MFLNAAARAQQSPENWVMMHSAALDAGGISQIITMPPGTPRSIAISLLAKGGAASLARILVTYGNGQVHFETRPGNEAIILKDGERTRPIDQRVESRIVESITLVFDTEAKLTTPARIIEVWGLRPPASGPGNVSGVRPRGENDVAADPKHSYVEVPVFFGTTRQKEGEQVKNDRKVAIFSGEQGAGLTLGRSIVTVPIERDPGAIPRPWNFPLTRYTFRNEDPNRDFTIAAVEEMTAETFASEMKKQLGVSKRYNGQAFVFVHGYNMSFDDAIFRTAQISHDIGFDGPAVTFSWPARGGTLDYRHDIDTAKASRDGLRQLLEVIASDTGVTAVNLVAHSMGNDPVIEVLREQAEITSRQGKTTDFKLNEIVLAAPDISRRVFEQFAARFVSLARGGVTLYASKNDLAMKLSKTAASGLIRAGDVPQEGILVVPGIESIDISDAGTGFLSNNHSTFAERAHIISDIQLLFESTRDKHPPDLRFRVYRLVGSQQKKWWRYVRN